MSNQQNDNYEEMQQEFKNDKPSIATDKDNHSGDSNFEREQ